MDQVLHGDDLTICGRIKECVYQPDLIHIAGYNYSRRSCRSPSRPGYSFVQTDLTLFSSSQARHSKAAWQAQCFYPGYLDCWRDGKCCTFVRHGDRLNPVADIVRHRSDGLSLPPPARFSPEFPGFVGVRMTLAFARSPSRSARESRGLSS